MSSNSDRNSEQLDEFVITDALIQPRLSKGVPGAAFGVIWGVVFMCALLLITSDNYIGAGIAILLGVIVHSLIAWVVKEDHRTFEIYKKYSVLPNCYHPFSDDKPTIGNRPEKFGRGMRL